MKYKFILFSPWLLKSPVNPLNPNPKPQTFPVAQSGLRQSLEHRSDLKGKED